MGTAKSTCIIRRNIFCYGNNESNNESAYFRFPYILSKICDFFSFEDCNFGVQKSKQSTARIALWRIVNTPAVYTIEASFYGASIGSLGCRHFGINDYQLMGSRICEAFIQYFNIDVSEIGLKPPQNVGLHETDFEAAINAIKERNAVKHLNSTTCEESSNASDSNPSEDIMDNEEKSSIQDIATEIEKTGKSIACNNDDINSKLVQDTEKETKYEKPTSKIESKSIGFTKQHPILKSHKISCRKRLNVAVTNPKIPTRQSKTSKTGRASLNEFVEMKDVIIQTDGDPVAFPKEGLTCKMDECIQKRDSKSMI